VRYDPDRPVRPQLTEPLNEALSQPVPRPSWRRRLAAWLVARLGLERLSGREGTAGGYWGGVTFWDVLKAAATRAKTAAATMFLRR
jgi:hypothetical protein